MGARALRHDLERGPLAFVRPRGPRVLIVRIADDQVDAAELVEQGAVFVRRLIDAARMGVDRTDHREVGRQRVELAERMTLAADRPRAQDEFRYGALLGSKDGPALPRTHFALRLAVPQPCLAGGP